MKLSLKNYPRLRLTLISYLACGLAILPCALVAETMGGYSSYSQAKRSLVINSQTGQKIRITPYGGGMVRVQVAAAGQAFFADDHYQMVERHDWQGSLDVSEQDLHLHLTIKAKENTGLFVDIDKSTMQLAFGREPGDREPGSRKTGSRDSRIFLREKIATDWTGSLITQQFAVDSSEHFTGLGHGYYGRVDSLDLRGQELERNYQRDQQQQAPLIVPFYISSKGYGVFLNSTFRNKFRFASNNSYSFSIDTGDYAKDGQMDYFVIVGPEIKDVLRRYIALTGHPLLPPKAMFGLALSDKGEPNISDGGWWQDKVQRHRAAGFALDHIVNDNRWRAAGGERCKSEFAWDKERYPSPKTFAGWAAAEQMAITLDFNRCIAPLSQGYNKTAFNIPNSDGMDFSDAAPDLTNPAVRHWWWNLIYSKGIQPLETNAAVGLWIDEFDQMGPAPDKQILNNGRSFAEMRNYWFMLAAKGLFAEGWDKSIGDAKRPFIWIRGNTAGAQRYSTLWSGDIQPSYEEMQNQIRGMQAAGLSGFPFWGHDAGGFDASGVKDFDSLYRQWSLAMGSFSPFWKPHGIGPSRWPLDRSPGAQADFLRYSQLRHQLMPYTYTYAHRAFATGEPIARPMLFNYPESAEAWQRDLQYLWGDSLLVAPNSHAPLPPGKTGATGDQVSVWLPPGAGWYDFWNDRKYQGGQQLAYTPGLGQLPLFAAAGSIIPMQPAALSIANAPQDILDIHIYTGADGKFTLYEDDGISANYQRGVYASQDFIYQDKQRSLQILPIKGGFQGAASDRRYQVIFHGLPRGECMAINGRAARPLADLPVTPGTGTEANTTAGWRWSDTHQRLSIYTLQQPRNLTLTISKIKNCPAETL